jgi:hypothetical protein
LSLFDKSCITVPYFIKSATNLPDIRRDHYPDSYLDGVLETLRHFDKLSASQLSASQLSASFCGKIFFDFYRTMLIRNYKSLKTAT